MNVANTIEKQVLDLYKTTSLSKSRYTKYCQCAKALWLSVNKPEEATIDAGVEATLTPSPWFVYGRSCWKW